MGNLVFKVESNKYVIFSTIVDDVTWFDMTREEVVEVLKEQAADDASHAAARMLDAADRFGCSSRRFGGGNFTPDGAWAHMVESYNMNRAEKLTVEQFKVRLQEEGKERVEEPVVFFALIPAGVYDHGLIGIYSTEEKAREAAEKIWPKTDGYHGFIIEPRKLDATHENVFRHKSYAGRKTTDGPVAIEHRKPEEEEYLRNLNEVTD